MAWVYILKSIKNKKFYIGSTKNWERRLKEHQAGKTKSLRAILPVKVVFKQKFSDLATAKRIEIKLKKLKRRDYLEKIIKDGYIKMAA